MYLPSFEGTYGIITKENFNGGSLKLRFKLPCIHNDMPKNAVKQQITK